MKNKELKKLQKLLISNAPLILVILVILLIFMLFNKKKENFNIGAQENNYERDAIARSMLLIQSPIVQVELYNANMNTNMNTNEQVPLPGREQMLLRATTDDQMLDWAIRFGFGPGQITQVIDILSLADQVDNRVSIDLYKDASDQYNRPITDDERNNIKFLETRQDNLDQMNLYLTLGHGYYYAIIIIKQILDLTREFVQPDIQLDIENLQGLVPLEQTEMNISDNVMINYAIRFGFGPGQKTWLGSENVIGRIEEYKVASDQYNRPITVDESPISFLVTRQDNPDQIDLYLTLVNGYREASNTSNRINNLATGGTEETGMTVENQRELLNNQLNDSRHINRLILYQIQVRDNRPTQLPTLPTQVPTACVIAQKEVLLNDIINNTRYINTLILHQIEDMLS